MGSLRFFGAFVSSLFHQSVISSHVKVKVIQLRYFFEGKACGKKGLKIRKKQAQAWLGPFQKLGLGQYTKHLYQSC